MRPPDDAMTVSVVGKRWMWKVQHPGGQADREERAYMFGGGVVGGALAAPAPAPGGCYGRRGSGHRRSEPKQPSQRGRTRWGDPITGWRGNRRLSSSGR